MKCQQNHVPVSDGEDCAAFELLPDGGLDEVVRLQVNGRRGLVQDEHLETKWSTVERCETRLAELGKILLKCIYRVTKVVADLGWVDLDLGCCTIWLGQ